jgi:hypothetical protein
VVVRDAIGAADGGLVVTPGIPGEADHGCPVGEVIRKNGNT